MYLKAFSKTLVHNMIKFKPLQYNETYHLSQEHQRVEVLRRLAIILIAFVFLFL